MPINNSRIIELPKIHDPKGNLTFVESSVHIPFDIKRVYYVYDVPGGSERGSHAHKDLQEFIIAISGSFDVEKWPRMSEQLSPIYKWTQGGLLKVQSCPRRRTALATYRPTRWATRGAPRIAF